MNAGHQERWDQDFLDDASTEELNVASNCKTCGSGEFVLDPAGRSYAAAVSDIPVLSNGAVQSTEAAITSRADALICADNYSQLIGLIEARKAGAETDPNS